MTGPRLAADGVRIINDTPAVGGCFVTFYVPDSCDLFAGARTDAGVEVRGLEGPPKHVALYAERMGFDLGLRLVDAPVPADTQNQGTWMGGGLEITYGDGDA